MYHRHSSDIVAIVPKSTINDIPLNANQSASTEDPGGKRTARLPEDTAVDSEKLLKQEK